MSNRGRPPSENELSLWKKITEGMNPLRKTAVTPDSSKPVFEKEDKVIPAPKTHSLPTANKKPQTHSVDPNIIRKTQKGSIPVESVLDMHGMIQDQAYQTLQEFVKRCFNRNMKCVLVITGKGTNSKADKDIFSSKRDGVGVLKTQFPQWIKQPPLNTMVSGCAEAHKKHGGAGAYYLYLKKSRPS